MALTALQFVNRFPEFRATDEDLIARRIAEAERRTPVSVWGDRVDDGAAYLAAHLLSVSPPGEQARIAVKDSARSNPRRTTLYLEERIRMEREITYGFRVS